MSKNPTSTAKSTGTIVEWRMRFWSPGAYKLRWTDSKNAIIRQVTCRILELDGTAEMLEHWRMEDIDSGFVNIQSGLDKLQPGRRYTLELAVPADSMYHSSGPAGPTTGRQKLAELPPFTKFDLYDYQVRPARFWFEVEPAPGLNPPANRICALYKEEEVLPSPRPLPARARLRVESKSPIRHVDVDWRPDWLRRGRSKGKDHIRPAGQNELRDGKPTHVVLHVITSPHDNSVSNIGSALNQFLNHKENGGVHYLVDVDGHVVKMCPDTRGLAHANTASWRGEDQLNRRSVGIEHAPGPKSNAFPDEQLRATEDLLRALEQEFGIDGRNIAGHGEVRCISRSESLDSAAIRAENRTPEQAKRVKKLEDDRRAMLKTEKKMSGEELEAAVRSYINSKNLKFDYDYKSGLALHPNSRLTSCPGRYFNWESLAKGGVVPDPWKERLPENWKETAYSGVFAEDENLKLRVGDDDRSQRWGGKSQEEWPAGSPVQELHDDLRAIGYAIPKNLGHEYTKILENVVKAFKARYSQTDTKDGVDASIAQMIKRVLAAYSRDPV